MAQQRMNVQAPIERLLARRWSSRSFAAEKAVTPEQVAACLEAARWAPSCFGAQPWRFIVADRFRDEPSWQQLLATLAPKNRHWAQRAPVLIVTVCDPLFAHNGLENRWAEYDAGQAAISLCLQAESLGLCCHQMGGFDAASLRTALQIPEPLHIMSVTALGHAGDSTTLEAELQSIEHAARARKPLSELVHYGVWGTPYAPPQAAGWEARYQETAVEQLPWFHTGLDDDIARGIDALALTDGAALDLGCGPGTQAVALAQRGFQVTASDVSWSAIEAARSLAEAEGVCIEFHVDNLLESTLSGPFDLVVDRGVFHCFADQENRQTYLETIRRLMKPGAILLLKCFHKSELSEIGPPGRYDEADIRGFFAAGFDIIDISNSHFGPTLCSEAPKALFCILKRRS
ncbi:methyltransferase domain-containing protein [Mariprofundus erugo]|uniref:nitroreductase family protein n=1 Tax=Mariprofundus erugo TaxID=2528639 RepID=UPI0010FE2DC9|nr:nitroreductase family protein [Mariprofundus erugo]TLS77155.1 methyltransferase domain-containing protein [Mariprofundus erugo]